MKRNESSLPKKWGLKICLVAEVEQPLFLGEFSCNLRYMPSLVPGAGEFGFSGPPFPVVSYYSGSPVWRAAHNVFSPGLLFKGIGQANDDHTVMEERCMHA
jgi:hypothetical protein